MPVGDCQRAFQEAAAADGVALVGSKHHWLTQRGHLGLPEQAASTVLILREIFVALGGDEDLLASARTTPLTSDFFFKPMNVMVEVDESQHFTSARLLALSLYPSNVALGFDRDDYERLCREHSARSDKEFAHKDAHCFGKGGRQRQRAYNDALRDLAAPALGHPGVVRAPAIDRDGRRAWSRVSDRLAAADKPMNTDRQEAGAMLRSWWPSWTACRGRCWTSPPSWSEAVARAGRW